MVDAPPAPALPLADDGVEPLADDGVEPLRGDDELDEAAPPADACT